MFYLNYYGKLDVYFIFKKRYPIIKKNASVIFIECTEMNCKHKYENGLCVSILLENMGWYLGVIGNIHNDERLI